MPDKKTIMKAKDEWVGPVRKWQTKSRLKEDLTLFGAERARNAAWPPGRARLIVLAVQAQTGVGGGGAYQAMEKLVKGAGALAAMRQVHPGECDEELTASSNC